MTDNHISTLFLWYSKTEQVSVVLKNNFLQNVQIKKEDITQ